MRIGAAGYHAETGADQRFGQHAGVGHHLLLVAVEALALGLLEADRLGRNHMHQGAALDAREDRLVDRRPKTLLAEDEPSPGSPHGLMSSRGRELGVGDWTGVQAGGHQAGDVGHVRHQVGPHLPGDLPEGGKVDHPGIGTGAGDDQPGPHLPCPAPDVFVVKDAIPVDSIEMALVVDA